MTDQPLPLKPYLCSYCGEEGYDPIGHNCSKLRLKDIIDKQGKLLAEKVSEIASLRQGKQVAQEAVLVQLEKVKEQAETIKILTEALEIVARRKCFDSVFIHGKGFTVCVCNEIGAKQALDRVRGGRRLNEHFKEKGTQTSSTVESN